MRSMNTTKSSTDVSTDCVRWIDTISERWTGSIQADARYWITSDRFSQFREECTLVEFHDMFVVNGWEPPELREDPEGNLFIDGPHMREVVLELAG